MKLKSRREFLEWGALSGLICSTPLVLSINESLFVLYQKSDHPFIKACKNGEPEVVKKMLSENPKLIDIKDQFSRSGFAIACLAGHESTAQVLKEAGYQTDLHEAALDLDWERFEMLTSEKSDDTILKVNADHPVGGCAMWAAAAGGAGTDIWRVYAKCGDPNCNPRLANGSTPLQMALRYRDLKVAEMTASGLLSNDANPNPTPNADLPPLHIAAERGSTALVEMLIRLDADINQKDRSGKLASETAEIHSHQNVWDMLIHHNRIARTHRTSRTAFDALGNRYSPPEIDDLSLFERGEFVGASHGNLEYVRKEIKRDARFAHSVATTNEICVEACAHTGQRPIVELLLSHGAPYSLPTAVMMDDFTSVKRLLDQDANRIHERGAHDFALLWYPLIGRCGTEMMELLLEHGAKVEEQHVLGTTALHWASIRGDIEMASLLIENGADINRIGRKFNAAGQTPLDLTKDEKLVDYLRSKGAVHNE